MVMILCLIPVTLTLRGLTQYLETHAREGVVMGLVNAKLVIKNPRKPELQPMEVDALADSGSVFLVIPPHVQAQLDLEETTKKEVTRADGSKKFVPYVGPVELQYKNRTGFFG